LWDGIVHAQRNARRIVHGIAIELEMVSNIRIQPTTKKIVGK
jgi:hypothetical protein